MFLKPILPISHQTSSAFGKHMLFYLPFLALTAVLSRLAHLFMYVLHYCLHRSSTDNKFCLAVNRYTKPANAAPVASSKRMAYQTGGTEKGGLRCVVRLISSCAQISRASSWHADPVTPSVSSLACEYIYLLISSRAPNLHCNRSSLLVNFELIFC
jgi:hypothetical protein